MYHTARRRSNMIERTSTSIKKLVKTVQTLLRRGIQFFEPGLTRFEAVKDLGSIDDITGDFCGSSTHMDRQLRKLGRLTIYEMCRYVDHVHVLLEKCYGAVRGWNEKELREFSQWRSIDLNNMDSGRKLNDAYTRLSDLIDDQLELLEFLKAEFIGMTDVRDSETKLMDLFEHLTQARFAVSLVQGGNGLKRDEARQQVKIQALREVIQREVDAHRSSNVILIEHLEGIVSLKSAEKALEFSKEVQARKEKLEGYMTTEERLSQA